MTILDGDVVKPGGQVKFRVRGLILNPERMRETGSCVLVRIRSLQSAQILFSTSTARQDIELPENGRFDLQVALEMNVEPGLYSIETGVFDRTSAKMVGDGPRVSVTVAPDFSFHGRAFARPVMKLVEVDSPATRPYAASL
jgi:hypothetical protein